MTRLRFPILVLLALAAGACASRPEPSTHDLPAATLAPIRLVTCPVRAAAASLVTHCIQEAR